MSKSTFKYISSTTRITVLVISLFTGAVIFYSAYKDSNDFKSALLQGGGIAAVLVLYLFVSEYLDKKRHKSILFRNNFKKIKKYFNFEIENLKDYWGFKGTYKKYFIRLFFDNFVRGGRLGILIYYKQPKTANGEVDIERLDRINAKYEIKGILKSTQRIYDTSHIRIFATGIFNRRASKVIRMIEDGIMTLSISNLHPIDEKEVDDLIATDPHIHTPLTETYDVGDK